MLPVDDPVRSVAAFDPVRALPGQTLRELARTMTEAGCSALLVDLRDGTHGIVTERDIVRGLADGAGVDEVWATDVMTRDLLAVDAEDTVGDAAELMVEAGVRHLVVVDEESERVGIVSIRDVVGPLLESFD